MSPKNSREWKFCNAVNNALTAHVEFFIYRTVDSQVKKLALYRMCCNIYTLEMRVNFKNAEGEIVAEIATQQDLKLLSDQARRYQEQQYAARKVAVR
jgi:hypothetical protein